jgi:hypothetical protein
VIILAVVLLAGGGGAYYMTVYHSKDKLPDLPPELQGLATDPMVGDDAILLSADAPRSARGRQPMMMDINDPMMFTGLK